MIKLHSLNKSKPKLLKRVLDKKVQEIFTHKYSAIIEPPSPDKLSEIEQIMKKSFDEDKPITVLNWARTRA